jgi:hypothetical protein
MPKPTICIDFDGVIHSYEKGWCNGNIYGTVTPGFFEWASVMRKHFLLVIYSSRSKDVDMKAAMWHWLKNQWGQWAHGSGRPFNHEVDVSYADFEFASEKPPAFMTIDDRAICFDGDWSKITPESIFNFKPWNIKNAKSS